MTGATIITETPELKTPDRPGTYIGDVFYGDPTNPGSPTHVWRTQNDFTTWYLVADSSEAVKSPPTSPFPFFGYAPGRYMVTCQDTGKKFEGDKYATRSLEAALIYAKKEIIRLDQQYTEFAHQLADLRYRRKHENEGLTDVIVKQARELSELKEKLNP